MKKLLHCVCLLLCAAFIISACGQKPVEEDLEVSQDDAPTWQEQYDLGIRYLSEGNYEEAIIAFTAAIEIDPKQPDAYLGLADVYVAQDDTEKAKEVLNNGLAEIENPALQARLDELSAEPDSLYNDYGATEFTHRLNYRPFSEMGDKEQNLLTKIGTSVIENNSENLYHLLESTDVHFIENATTVKTIWNDYKLELYFSPYAIDEEGDLKGELFIEMRPEEGVGYYCSVYSNSAALTEGRDSWWDYYYSSIYITCHCEDWQWNGTMNSLQQGRRKYQSADGYSNESQDSIFETGIMKNSLRDGAFHETGDSPLLGNDREIIRVYQAGHLIEVDGERQASGLYGAGIYKVLHMDNIDSLYW